MYPPAAKLCASAVKVAKLMLAQLLADRQQLLEPETSVLLQENIVEILLKHLERVCGIKHGKDDEDGPVTLAKACETSVDAIVQLLRLL